MTDNIRPSLYNAQYQGVIANNVENNDERNRFLAEKARSMTFYYSILIEAIGIIVLRILDYDEPSTIIGFAICIQLIIYWLSYLWLKKKY